METCEGRRKADLGLHGSDGGAYRRGRAIVCGSRHWRHWRRCVLPAFPPLLTKSASPPALLQIDVKLSVRGNPRGRGTEAHHQRDQIVEVTVYTLRCVQAMRELGYSQRACLRASRLEAFMPP